MSNTDQPQPVDDNAAGLNPDTIPNTALFQRKEPRTTLKYLEEIAKTGNPLAWCLMKLWEPQFEFAPQFVPEDGDKGPILQKPIRYGLKEYRVKDLHLDTGEHVTAWYKAAKANYPTIVYCHGNAGSLDTRAAILQELTDRGFGMIIAAYPGFKGHKERPKLDPSESACNATGHAMVRYLINTKHVPMEKIVLFGESLGGAVALRTAFNIEKGIPELGYEPMKAPPVICFNTFTSLVKRAKEQFPMLPADFLMGNRFESDKIIRKIDAPILLMHGTNDEFTSCQHSIDLQRISGGKATLELLDGVTHSANHRGTDKKDPDQIRRVINCAHHYLNGLGLCPAVPDNLQTEEERIKASQKAKPKGEWKNVVKPDTHSKGISPDVSM